MQGKRLFFNKEATGFRLFERIPPHNMYSRLAEWVDWSFLYEENRSLYSPTDPDARISLKPGKARALNYLCSLAVDTAQGVISHVQADLADSRDSLHLPRLLTSLQQRLRANELPLPRPLLAASRRARRRSRRTPVPTWTLAKSPSPNRIT